MPLEAELVEGRRRRSRPGRLLGARSASRSTRGSGSCRHLAQLLATDVSISPLDRGASRARRAGRSARTSRAPRRRSLRTCGVARGAAHPGLSLEGAGRRSRGADVGDVAVLHDLDLPPSGRRSPAGRRSAAQRARRSRRGASRARMSTARGSLVAVSKAPSPESASGSSPPGNSKDTSNEKRPLVASALVDADCASCSKLIGSPVLHAAAAGLRHSPRRRARRRRGARHRGRAPSGWWSGAVPRH